jgi:hypothetical protein
MLGHLVTTHHDDDEFFVAPIEPRWFTWLMRLVFGH